MTLHMHFVKINKGTCQATDNLIVIQREVGKYACAVLLYSGACLVGRIDYLYVILRRVGHSNKAGEYHKNATMRDGPG